MSQLQDTVFAKEKVYTCQMLKILAKYSKTSRTRGKVWTNPLLSIWTPSVLSTRFNKSVYFLLVETVIRSQSETVFS